MKIRSLLSVKKYLSAMKERMDSHFSFGAERCTGFFLGPFLSVTYHSGWEWNRRITNQKNTAVGFVRETNEGCEIRCIMLKGLLAPHLFALTFLAAAAIYLFVALANDHWTPEVRKLWLPLCLILTLIMTAADAFYEALTEESQEGSKILKSILMAPSDPFSYLNHRNEIH